MRIALRVIAALIALAVAAAITGAASWRRATRADVAALVPASSPNTAFDPRALAGVPQPVARYLQKAIITGHPPVRSATVTQDAEFFINGHWRPLRATQHFSTTPPGFVWDARIEMAPLVPVFVRDAYVDGRAKMQASMYGVLSMADQIDTPQLNAGALQRFLGESIWFPTALLPSSTVTWRARDDRSAFVTLRDGRLEVTLLFEFGDDGMPSAVSGDRYKENQGQYALQTWHISCGETAIRDGLTIPLRCEVAWVSNGVREPYWRGRLSSIEYRYDMME
jgi:hypothetical protein